MPTLDDLQLSPELSGDGAGVLPIPRDVLAAMLTHVAAGYPDEACGVLAGQRGRVVRHFATANASATPRTFSEIAPGDLLQIWNTLEDQNWDMLAYYHSHPVTPAYPSPRDILWSRGWPGTYYVIFSLANPTHPVARAFLINGEAVHEYRLTIA